MSLLPVLVVVMIGFAFIVGGKRGPSKLMRFLFAPGISCAGRIAQAMIALVFLGLVFSYGVSHVIAPNAFRIPGLPLPPVASESKTQQDPQRITVLLDVPFNKQELPTSGMKNNICGYASLSMAAGYARGFQPSMQTNVKILQYLGLNPDGQELSSSDNIIKAGKGMYDLDLTPGKWSIDQIKSELAGGHPIIAGITAGEVPRDIRGYDYSGGHYLVVIGYDQDSIIVNDPGTRNGYRKHYPISCFENAFQSSGASVIAGFKR